MEKRFFNLYSCCIPVKGFNKAIICDLQRDRIHPIPIVLYEILIHFTKKGKSIVEIEILVNYDASYSKNNILELRKQYARLRKLTLFNAQYNKILVNIDLYVLYIKQSVLSENCCGVVSPWYFTANTVTFIEAKNYNSCLNRKISIDQHGNIKNCPSMKFSYGNIKTDKLSDIVNKKEFTMLWNISKDKIMVFLL